MKLKHHTFISKPWGSFEQFALNQPCTVKLIKVKAKKRLSYQSHQMRSELWVCVKGLVMAVINGRKKTLKEGSLIMFGPKTKHRLAGLKNDGMILEVSFGKFNEKDIVRYEDDYGRAKPAKAKR
jgi:mannose-6-phosphate isomerase-like protein (cupin superfamily)